MLPQPPLCRVTRAKRMGMFVLLLVVLTALTVGLFRWDPAMGRIEFSLGYFSPSSSVSSPQALPAQSWAFCHCDAELHGCSILLYGVTVRIVDGIAVVSAALEEISPGSISQTVNSCATTTRARMATPSESWKMRQEGPRFDLSKLPELTIVNRRTWEHNNVLFPTGALELFATQARIRDFLNASGMAQFVRITDWPTSTEALLGVHNFTETSLILKLHEYSITVDRTPGVIKSLDLGVSTTAYHSIGVYTNDGLHGFDEGMTVPLRPDYVELFKRFRANLLEKSLAASGDVPFNETSPVLYSPRSIRCESKQRVRFIPRDAAARLGKSLLAVTKGVTVTTEEFVAPASEYPRYFHSVRSRRVMYGAEGAFFMWMLLSKPETVWVVYVRASHDADRRYGFFGVFARMIPDLKMVVFRVVNGVAPPLEHLERAVREPFKPLEVKYVGANASGDVFDNGSSDPVLCNCVDDGNGATPLLKPFP